MLSTDLNCDMGEGMENDALLMPLITSANIACGYHAGDEATMIATIDLAIKHRVAIGAHPGFNDKINFGRTEMHLPPNDLYALVAHQVNALQQLCTARGVHLHHVKPHGALYNMAARNTLVAQAIARAVYDAGNQLILYGLSGSALVSEAARLGVRTANEVFADRTYQDDGSLTPRTYANALINSAENCMEQVLQMVQHKTVTSINGLRVSIAADTICLHGDGAHAVAFAHAINQQLTLQHIAIRSV